MSEEERIPLVATAADSRSGRASLNPQSFQYRALMRKNATLQIRQRSTVVCQALVPVLLMLVGGLFQLILNSVLPVGPPVYVVPPVIPLKWPFFISTYYQFYTYTPPPVGNGNVGYLFSNGSGDGLLGAVPQSVYSFPNETGIGVPFFNFIGSETAAQELLLAQLHLLGGLPLYEVRSRKYETYYMLPTGYINFEQYNHSDGQLSYSARINDQKDYIRMPKVPPPSSDTAAAQLLHKHHLVRRLAAALSPAVDSTPGAEADAFSFAPLGADHSDWAAVAGSVAVMGSGRATSLAGTRLGDDPFDFLFGNVNVTIPRAFMVSMVHSALASAWRGIELAASLTGFPFVLELDNISVLDFLGYALYPYALSFLIPALMYPLVLERESGVLQLMTAVGLRRTSYFVAHFLFSYFLYILVAIVFLITGFAFQVRFFTQSSPILIVALLLAWGFALVAFAELLSNLFARTRTASIVAYLVVIFSVNFGVYFNTSVYKTETPMIAYWLYPPFVFYRGIYNMIHSCTAYACLQADALMPGQEMGRVVATLLFQALIMIGLTAYAVQASTGGLLWCLAPLRRRLADRGWCCSCCRDGEAKPDAADAPAGAVGPEDADVQEEQRKVEQGDLPADCAIVIRDMHKRYDAKHALRGVSFHVRSGECFGLLGPNGAGKSTLLSILTGIHEPTDGSASIAGYDIVRDRERVKRVIGICPQHDHVWEDLTCREHLLFYCRLKGVAAADEDAAVMGLLESVGLDAVPDRRAGELSGGMKRRLSVAMSLCGDPSIVFMDEPTTGTDAHTRQMLWTVIARAARGRCVLLTTHRMDEADVLCSRIAILARGRLRCIGPQQVLKSRFGEGYVIRVNYPADAEQRASDFVRIVAPAAQLSSSAVGTAAFAVPRRAVRMADVVVALKDRGRAEGAITAWSISQTSLEDVFLNIVHEAEGVGVR